MTPDTALRLAKFFDTTPVFRMNFQTAWELAAEASAKKEEIGQIRVMERARSIARSIALAVGICIEYIFDAMEIEWSPARNTELKERHGFGFERILVALSEGALLDERAHPNTERYAHQRQLVVAIEGYAWVVPFVTDGEKIFLKTMFPSRKATKDYFGG